MRYIILNISILFFVSAQSLDSLFQVGNKFYELEEYRKAVNIYENIEKQVINEDLYLNLGNSYFKIGDLGNAIWSYEKAHSLSPRDKDIIYNLKFARTQVRDRIISPDSLAIIKFYQSIIDKITILDIISIGGLLFLFSGIIFLMKYYIHISLKLTSLINSSTIICFLLVIWVSIDKYWSLSDVSEAVIVTPAVDVRSSPIIKGENIVFRIHEGTKAKITITQSVWCEVVLLDGKKGWILAKDIRLL